MIQRLRGLEYPASAEERRAKRTAELVDDLRRLVEAVQVGWWEVDLGELETFLEDLHSAVEPLVQREVDRVNAKGEEDERRIQADVGGEVP